MKKFAWVFVLALVVVLVGCGEDDMSVPEGALEGWTRQTVQAEMTRCQNRDNRLNSIIEIRKACRCAVETMAPKVRWMEFSQTGGPIGLYATASRACKEKYRR